MERYVHFGIKVRTCHIKRHALITLLKRALNKFEYIAHGILCKAYFIAVQSQTRFCLILPVDHFFCHFLFAYLFSNWLQFQTLLSIIPFASTPPVSMQTPVDRCRTSHCLACTKPKPLTSYYPAFYFHVKVSKAIHPAYIVRKIHIW